MSLEWRNRARERRLERRRSRKLFKTGAKQPPQVYAAYLDGLVQGALLREVQEIRMAEYPTFDYFDNHMSGMSIDVRPAVLLDDEDDERDFAPQEHFVLH